MSDAAEPAPAEDPSRSIEKGWVFVSPDGHRAFLVTDVSSANGLESFWAEGVEVINEDEINMKARYHSEVFWQLYETPVFKSRLAGD